MKKYIPVVLLIIVFGFGIFYFRKNYSNLQIKSAEGEFKFILKYKGLKGAKDFIFDGEGNCYIAFPNKVQMINKNGKSIILFENNKYNIYSIAYNANKLFFVSECSLISYDLVTKTLTEIMNNLPNFGDYKRSRLLVKDNILYVTIGAATNSGVVGEDNLWLKNNPFQHDVSPKNLTISSRISQKQKNGAFVPYNTKNVAGQVIPASYPGNASIIGVNTNDFSSWLYAWGIRNVTGIDYNSEGKVFFSTSGMEDRGVRPIKGDVDYIYELKENAWYGWPDYSGGDPVNSPRFGVNISERVPFILDKHPTTNPPAPIYQHKDLSTMKEIVVDRKGLLGEKDSIYFYEIKDSKIYEINKTGLAKEKVKFNSNTTVESMKIYNEEFLFLDSAKGRISAINIGQNRSIGFTKGIEFYLLGLTVIIIITILWKLKN